MNHLQLELNWEKENGLIPAVVQDSETGVVLMLGYMNEEALRRTLDTKRVWFYSRSKRRLWMKGETTGNILELVDIKTDCDNDALLVRALPYGPACHTGSMSCFKETKVPDILSELYGVIAERKRAMPSDSYTAELCRKGLAKICEKVREESEELIQAAKKESRRRIVEESVDVLYHLFVLLVQQGVRFSDLVGEVKRRRKC
jgi:phosphoribosyl-ATP pyrophosphohydrolase/phosphoribosyl-AMP cyclohydrolase